MQNPPPPPPSVTLTIENFDVNALAALIGSMNLSVNITATPSNTHGNPDNVPHLPTPPTHSPNLPSSAPSTPRRQGRRSALHQVLPQHEPNSANPPLYRDPPGARWICPGDPRTCDPNIERYYVVVRGRCTGIFDDWFYVEELIRGLKAHAIFRKLPTFEQAWAAYEGAKARGTVRCIDRNGVFARHYNLLYGPVDECMQ